MQSTHVLAPDEEICAFVTPWWRWRLGPKCEITFLSAAKILSVGGLCQGSVGAGAGCVQGDAVAGMLWGTPREKGEPMILLGANSQKHHEVFRG